MTPPRTHFQTVVTVRFDEFDPLRHVNNAVYLAWLEQAAIDHAGRAGWPEERQRAAGGVFNARRHEIDYLHPATHTWPEAFPPDYDFAGEFAALIDAAVVRAVRQSGIKPVTFSELALAHAG